MNLVKTDQVLRRELDNLGYNIQSNSQIIAIESGLEKDTEILRDELEKNNIFGAVFCSPATPKNRSVIRFSVNSKLTRDQIDHTILTFKNIRETVGMFDWKSTKRKS